jgi:hypothetical protein
VHRRSRGLGLHLAGDRQIAEVGQPGNGLAGVSVCRDAGPVPGQRKRKRQQEASRQQAAARFAEAGHWDVLIETQDESDWHAQVRRLRAENQQIDWTAVRIDTFCGRMLQPTTYRLSLFVPSEVPAESA